MNTNLFLTKKVFGELGIGKIHYSITILILLVLFLSSFFLLFLVRSQPRTTATTHVYAKEGQIMAELGPLVEESQVNDLFIKIRGWDSVERIKFYFSEELEKAYANIPSQISRDSDLFVIEAIEKVNREKLVGELENIEGISRAVLLGEDVVMSGGLFQFPDWFKIVSLAGTVVFSLLALKTIHGLIKRFTKQWRGEFEILKYSGIGSKTARLPFVLFGLLWGLLGSVLGIVVLFVFKNWASGTQLISESLPVLENNSFFMGLALWAAFLGPFLGLLGSLLGSGTIDDIWQTPYHSTN